VIGWLYIPFWKNIRQCQGNQSLRTSIRSLEDIWNDLGNILLSKCGLVTFLCLDAKKSNQKKNQGLKKKS